MTEVSIGISDPTTPIFGHCVSHVSLWQFERDTARRPGNYPVREHGSHEESNDPRTNKPKAIKAPDEEFTKEQWDEYTDALEAAIITVKMKKYDKYIKEEKQGTIQEAGKRFLRTIREQTSERLKKEKLEKEKETNRQRAKHEEDEDMAQTKEERRQRLSKVAITYHQN